MAFIYFSRSLQLPQYSVLLAWTLQHLSHWVNLLWCICLLHKKKYVLLTYSASSGAHSTTRNTQLARMVRITNDSKYLQSELRNNSVREQTVKYPIYLFCNSFFSTPPPPFTPSPPPPLYAIPPPLTSFLSPRRMLCHLLLASLVWYKFIVCFLYVS